jgi:molybdopterin-guanine dinucleotide biosynthesis protein A
VLVGGPSRSARAGEPASDEPATRIARLLETLFEDVLLVGDAPPDGAPGRRVPDRDGPPGALRGLVTALESAAAPRVLVVGCDRGGVTPDLLLALVASPEADAVVPRDDRGVHPLCSLYARDAVLPPARQALEAGDGDLEALLAAVETHQLSPEDLAAVDPEGRALRSARAHPLGD